MDGTLWCNELMQMTDPRGSRYGQMKENQALIKGARSEALEWSIYIDHMLNAIIAEYFVENETRKQLFENEILTRDFIPSSRKIGILADLHTVSDIPYRKKYPRLIRQLEKLNSYRNVLAHGFPDIKSPPHVKIHRGRMKQIPINRRVVRQMESMYEIASETLSNLYVRVLYETR